MRLCEPEMPKWFLVSSCVDFLSEPLQKGLVRSLYKRDTAQSLCDPDVFLYEVADIFTYSRSRYIVCSTISFLRVQWEGDDFVSNIISNIKNKPNMCSGHLHIVLFVFLVSFADIKLQRYPWI